MALLPPAGLSPEGRVSDDAGPGRVNSQVTEVALPSLVVLVVLTVSVVVEAVAAETKDALDFLGHLTLYLKRQQGPNRSDSLLGGMKR